MLLNIKESDNTSLSFFNVILGIRGSKMNNIINRIIEIDKKAKDLISYADKQNEELIESVEKEKKELISNMAKESKEKLETVRKTENEYADSKIQKLIEEKLEAIDKLNQAYEENHQEWEDKIFKRMLEYAE